ncbi:MAG: hypothetical protein Q7R22_009145 [Verrucomicrobiota bacterium JB025]|nr:hypothetical protein [Verrucomicrobiota bacterium JB025]
MKLTKVPFIASAMFSMVGSAKAQVQLGDVLRIDFGNTAPGTANWNQYNSTTGASVALNRFSDGAATGVSIAVTNTASIGNFGNHVASVGGSTDATVFADHIAGNSTSESDVLTITISGLDDTLGYDLAGGFTRTGGVSAGSTQWGNIWDVDGDIRVNAPSATEDIIEAFETFSGVATTSPGVIEFTIAENTGSTIVSIAELTITASVLLDSDGDGLNDLWEDEHFGDNSGTVEPSDLSPQDGFGDGFPVEDGDGLTNAQEQTAGTDPNVADTDGDNLSDGDEVNTHFTNPTLADTDSDHIDDDKELAGQDQSGASTGFGATDPLLADSDTDGVCDGDEVAFAPPSDPNTPDDTDGDLIPNATEDANVNCVVDAGETDPLNPDSDGDNLTDGAEDANQNGVVDTGETNPLLADSDGDNIDDDKELAGQNQSGAATGFGPTDPTLADSDLDGYNDDVELGAGTNPNDINHIPVVSLAAGTIIGIDFGADDGAPVNWNTLASPGASVSAGSLTNLGGSSVIGVGFTTNIFTASGENDGAQVSTSYPDIPDGAQGDWWFESNSTDDFVFTFSGLDDNLKYDLLIGAYRLNLDPVQTELAASGWEVNGTQMATDPNDSKNSYVTFSGLETDGSGNLTIVSYSLNGDHVNAVSALVLTAASSVPQLKIASAANGTELEFSWESNAGKLYDILRSTDLSTSPATWDVWQADIPADASGSNLEIHARPGDPKSFFVLVEKDVPALFEEDFEADNGGFTSVVTEGTDWAWGTPASAGYGGTVSVGNGASTKCWGTNIGTPGFYLNPTTESCLRSAVIDLTGVAAAELSFAQAIDIHGGDSVTVNIIDDTTDTVIAADIVSISDGNVTSAAWETVGPIEIPAAALGQAVRIEWCFSGTGGTTEDYLGWYIDDVEVREQ